MSQTNFWKSEIEVCGNFDHINLPTDMLSNAYNITACSYLFHWHRSWGL